MLNETLDTYNLNSNIVKILLWSCRVFKLSVINKKLCDWIIFLLGSYLWKPLIKVQGNKFWLYPWKPPLIKVQDNKIWLYPWKPLTQVQENKFWLYLWKPPLIKVKVSRFDYIHGNHQFKFKITRFEFKKNKITCPN